MAAGSCSSQCPSIFRDKCATFLLVKGGHLSHEVLMTCFGGEGRGQRVIPAPATAQIPSAYKIPCQGAIFWGSVF